MDVFQALEVRLSIKLAVLFLDLDFGGVRGNAVCTQNEIAGILSQLPLWSL